MTGRDRRRNGAEAPCPRAETARLTIVLPTVEGSERTAHQCAIARRRSDGTRRRGPTRTRGRTAGDGRQEGCSRTLDLDPLTAIRPIAPEVQRSRRPPRLRAWCPVVQPPSQAGSHMRTSPNRRPTLRRVCSSCSLAKGASVGLAPTTGEPPFPANIGAVAASGAFGRWSLWTPWWVTHEP